MNRRDFMKSTVVAGAAAAFARPGEAAVPPGDRLTVGFIGCGARAHEHLDDVKSMAGVEVVAVADAYTGRAERARARTGGRAAIVGDYREILANPGIDAVFIVTPDHWHQAMVVEALAAKKDVYVEKPMSYSIEDGLAMVAAAKKSDRIVQVGSQGVSGADMIKARELVKAGKIGRVVMVRAAYNRNSASGAWLYPIPPDASPSTVNWDQFIGPAPKRAFDLERFFRWRCYWDYSGGVATDLFVHLVSWLNFVTDAKMPSGVMATGENYGFKKTHEVPDTVNALLVYPESFHRKPVLHSGQRARQRSQASKCWARRAASCSGAEASRCGPSRSTRTTAGWSSRGPRRSRRRITTTRKYGPSSRRIPGTRRRPPARSTGARRGATPATCTSRTSSTACEPASSPTKTPCSATARPRARTW